MKTKGIEIPYINFREYREDFHNLGMSYIANFADPSEDIIVIPMPREEVYSNLAERLVDGGYMSGERRVYERRSMVREKKERQICQFFLACYTSWGSVCHRSFYPTKTAALSAARQLKRDGFCFSYSIQEIKNKTNEKENT